MAMTQEMLNQRVDDFISSIQADFVATIDSIDPQDMKQATVNALHRLVDTFGTSDYGFNLSVELFVERFCDLIRVHLPDILSLYMPKHIAFVTQSTQTNIAFVAYYALSLIYKKEDREADLKNLTDEKYRFFTQLYPLAFEVRSRYYKRVHEYENALDADEFAIEYLANQNIINYALRISYASTVCRMYEEGYSVEPDQHKHAKEYIDNAIQYNPNYPKYYYLKAKLIFYSGRKLQNSQQFNKICDEAVSNIKHARRLLMGQPSAHFEKSLNEYNELLNKISQETRIISDQLLPFRPFSKEELHSRIQAVISAENPKECLPPNPNLKPGQKYFFVSYSRKDFKAVYCDLLMLYANKIPFQYDACLSKGERWDEEVHKYINREECLGVVFFISRNTPLSEAVEIECRLALEFSKKGKRYFTVNLEGDLAPTKLLMHCVLDHGVDTCWDSQLRNPRMITFLNTFNDNIIYVSRPNFTNPEESPHISELIDSIKQTFPELLSNEPETAYSC